MSKRPTETGDVRIDLEAAEWLVRCDHGLTPVERAEFDRWLAADPSHGKWLARHQAIWTEFDALAACRPGNRAEPDPDILAPIRSSRRWTLPIALAAAAALAFGLFLWRPWTLETPDRAPSLVAAQGYERHSLEDGSVVELNRGAAVDTRFTPGERRVLLVSGEAHFTVAKNHQRPFIVRAGDVEVRAVGTAFDVRLDSRSVTVLVTDGTVWIHPPSALPAARYSDLPALAAGESAVVPLAQAPAELRITQVSSAEMSRLLAWRPTVLDFSSTPLADVVARFNACNRVQIIIAEPGLRSLPIVASFRSDNVEGFVRLLEVTAGVKAERPDADEIILHRSR